MSAQGSFRRVLVAALSITLLFIVAIAGPLIAGSLLSKKAPVGRDDLLVCLMVPTPSDWLSHTLSYAIAAVLSVSLFAALCSLLRQWYRTRRMMRSLLRLRVSADAQAWGRLAIVEIYSHLDFIDTERPLAFCYGWVRPRICLSRGAVAGLQVREVEALLLHEYLHLLHRDPLRSAVSHALSTTFFFLPVIKAWQKQYLLAKEIEADEYALRTQGTDRPLLAALYKLLMQQAHKANKLTGVGATGVGATDAINRRLDYLLDGVAPAGPHVTSLFISSFVVASITSVVAITIWAAVSSAFWNQAHSLLGGC
ncbi:MAG: M56 family metallopeptidase [Chloroflexi bacterium]|nr:M56 family metallopeptidase [Chloroflexota bacterium]